MLLKQRSEELQASGGQLYAGAWRGGHGANHLLPGQAQVVTVAEPDQNNLSLIYNNLSHSLSEYSPCGLVTPSLYEETVEGQEALAAQPFGLDPLGVVLHHHGLEAVQGAGLQVHVEAAPLEPGELRV